MDSLVSAKWFIFTVSCAVQIWALGAFPNPLIIAVALGIKQFEHPVRPAVYTLLMTSLAGSYHS